MSPSLPRPASLAAPFAPFAPLALAGAIAAGPAGAALELPAPKLTVDVDGATVSYYEAGDPDGAPVVFVHGLPFSSYIWRDVVRALEDEDGGHRLIALDLVGFGDSTGDGYGVLDQANHLGAFVDALELDDVVLVGHDWGAGIALTWAGANPDEVAGFATMEGAMPPVYPRPAYDEMPERIAGMFRSMRGPDAEANVLEDNLWLDTIMPTMSEAPLPDAVVAEYRRPFPTPGSRRPILEMSRSLPIGGEPADVVAAYGTGVDWWTSSDAPKLVIYAEPGRLYGPELAAWNEENAPNATLRSVGPGRHALQEESPEAVADALAPWLANLTDGEDVGTRAIDLDAAAYEPSPAIEGVETATLFGSRSAPELYATHARVAAGVRVPPHVHPNPLTTWVTSGTAWVGTGETFDEAALVAYPAGTYFVTPANSPHFIMAKTGAFSILDHGSGPSGTTIVDPGTGR